MGPLEIISGLISIFTLITIMIAFRDKIFNAGKSAKCSEDRLADLEKKDMDKDKKLYDIGQDIKVIKENHLVHIQADINDIKVMNAIILNNVNDT